MQFFLILSCSQDEFNKGGGGSKMADLRAQVSEVKEVMAKNVEQVLERGERLDNLVDRSEDLEASVSQSC